jgi:hypothetical protein
MSGQIHTSAGLPVMPMEQEVPQRRFATGNTRHSQALSMLVILMNSNQIHRADSGLGSSVAQLVLPLRTQRFVTKRGPLIPVLSQLNPVHNFTLSLKNTIHNIISHPCQRCPSTLFPSDFMSKTLCLCIYHLFHTYFYVGHAVGMKIHRWIITANHNSFCILDSLMQHVSA